MTARDAALRTWWWLTRTFAGRLLLVALGIKAVIWIARAAGASSPILSAVNAAASALLLIAFFSISGLLLFFNMGSFMLRARVATLV